MYLYCQNPTCGSYLGSLGSNDCHLCGWHINMSEEQLENLIYNEDYLYDERDE